MFDPVKEFVHPCKPRAPEVDARIAALSVVEVDEGARVVSVRAVPGGKYGRYAPAIYVATADGWRLDRARVNARTAFGDLPSSRTKNAARVNAVNLCLALRLPFCAEAKSYQPVRLKADKA